MNGALPLAGVRVLDLSREQRARRTRRSGRRKRLGGQLPRRRYRVQVPLHPGIHPWSTHRSAPP